MSDDIQHMQHALRLAQRGLGRTWPNPSVGAVIVKNGVIIGRGATAKGGRPHAEPVALAQAGASAKGATLYVTLEPCCHQGKTPPCTDAIIAAGIKRVVFGAVDPFPQVAGKGVALLRAAGIEVAEKCLEKEARALNEGFFSSVERKRPFVTLKLATSLDGKIADADGNSKWITCETSRKKGHFLRGSHDAILTGIGTVMADEPTLTCRLPGRLNDSPQRIVLDGKLRTSPKAKILPAWIFTSQATEQDSEAKIQKLNATGATVLSVATEDEHVSLYAVLQRLGEMGVTRLLVEAGSSLATAFIKKRYVDRIYWFRAPFVMGENGLSALKGHDLPLKDLPHYRLKEVSQSGDDTLEIYECEAE